jgi:HTH-type transcriptional regulator/antitoxin MqsA
MDNNATCRVCGELAELISIDQEIKIGSRSAVVLDEFYRCVACESEFYAPGQMEATQRRAADTIRRDLGLLLPQEIKAVREKLCLTQADFEKLLGVGPKTVVRWERGTVFQNKSTDALLRLLDARHDNALLLARLHGVEIPTNELIGTSPASTGEHVQYRDVTVRARTERSGLGRFWEGQPLILSVDIDDVSKDAPQARCA